MIIRKLRKKPGHYGGYVCRLEDKRRGYGIGWGHTKKEAREVAHSSREAYRKVLGIKEANKYVKG